MSTTVTINFTVAGNDVTLTDGEHTRSFGIPAGVPFGDLQFRDPVGFAAASEFKSLGTVSGVITVTAV